MWQEEDEQLVRVFRFNSFTEAFAFIAQVALAAEKLGHYPTWTNTYEVVTVRLGQPGTEEPVSDKDHFLAAAIDHIYGD